MWHRRIVFLILLKILWFASSNSNAFSRRSRTFYQTLLVRLNPGQAGGQAGR